MKGSWKSTLIFLLVGLATGALAQPALAKDAPLSLGVAFIALLTLTVIGGFFGLLGSIAEINASNAMNEQPEETVSKE